MRITILSLTLALAAATAQQSIVVQRAEMAIAFGTVPGKLVVMDRNLLFIDDDKPESSFAISSDNVSELTVEAAMVSISLRQPVRDREGPRSRINFRLPEGAGTSAISAWFDRGGNVAAAAAAAKPKQDTAAPKPAGAATYAARHKHTFGGCDGSLVILADQVNFESVSDASHSRRWTYRDIKEVRRKNPFALSIQPFGAGEYDFEVRSPGIDQPEYQALVDRVTKARLGDPR